MVKIFKMIDGDDIIASVEKTTKENITLKMPVRIGMTALGVDRMLLCAGTEEIESKIQKKPKIFFIQLGFEAKLKSLQIIEELRKHKVPISQSLSKDSLGIQLGMAERMDIPYALIYGQKEAMDKEVIIRNMHTRSQETVKIDKLVEHIKKLK
jgi:histidyl-tRNA synthetase